MKIGVSYWMFDGGLEAKKPIIDAMREAKDLGFDSIELAIADQGVLTDQATQSQCSDIVSAAKKIGIEISSLASGQSWFWSPTSDDPETRRRITDFTKKALQIANWLGTDAYLFVPGAVDVFFLPDAPIVPYDICYKRSIEIIDRLIPTAKQTNVTICIENVWNKFLLSPLEMKDFILGFRSPLVGSYFDIGNCLALGYPDQWLRILGPSVKRIHVKDFKKSIGTADGFVDLLEGDVDFEAVKKALADIKYDGFVTAEVLPFKQGRLEKTARALRNIFK